MGAVCAWKGAEALGITLCAVLPMGPRSFLRTSSSRMGKTEDVQQNAAGLSDSSADVVQLGEGARLPNLTPATFPCTMHLADISLMLLEMMRGKCVDRAGKSK